MSFIDIAASSERRRPPAEHTRQAERRRRGGRSSTHRRMSREGGPRSGAQSLACCFVHHDGPAPAAAASKAHARSEPPPESATLGLDAPKRGERPWPRWCSSCGDRAVWRRPRPRPLRLPPAVPRCGCRRNRRAGRRRPGSALRNRERHLPRPRSSVAQKPRQGNKGFLTSADPPLLHLRPARRVPSLKAVGEQHVEALGVVHFNDCSWISIERLQDMVDLKAASR